jgi:hypothetical protein
MRKGDSALCVVHLQPYLKKKSEEKLLRISILQIALKVKDQDLIIPWRLKKKQMGQSAMSIS